MIPKKLIKVPIKDWPVKYYAAVRALLSGNFQLRRVVQKRISANDREGARKAIVDSHNRFLHHSRKTLKGGK